MSGYAISPGWKVLMMDMGLPPERVLRRAGLPGDLFSRTNQRMSADQFYVLWRSLEEELGVEELPLMLAQTVSIEAFDPPLFAALCSRDLRQAVVRIAAYKRLIGPIKVRVEEVGGGLRIEKIWPLDHDVPASFGRAELMFWVALMRLATRVEVVPKRMEGPAPADLSSYAGRPIEHGPTWAITFTELDASRPFVTHRPAMWAFFEPELRRRLGELDAAATTAERVRAVLLESLPAGESSAERVARKLAMSKRTLQRRLTGEGTSFQRLLAETRESLARHYLRKSELPAAEISFLLGYEDPNSFYRAFHAWTGTTPERLRLAK